MSALATFAIGEIAIRQLNDLFCLNDLHKAAGGEVKHKPSFFLRLDQTQALVAEIQQVADSQLALKVVHGGKERGTYACRELVIAYAAWISAAFHLKVIRVFLAAAAPQPEPAQARLDYDRTGRYEKPGREKTLNEMVDFFVHQVETPNGAPSFIFLPLVNAVLKKRGFDLAISTGPASGFLPEAQAKEITERLDRLGKLFHPLSQQFTDVLGIVRALRGLHPAVGMPEPGYRQLLQRQE